MKQNKLPIKTKIGTLLTIGISVIVGPWFYLCVLLGVGECSLNYTMPLFPKTVVYLTIALFFSGITLLLSKSKMSYILTVLLLVSLITSSFLWPVPQKYQDMWPDTFTYPSRLFIKNQLGFCQILVIISALILLLSDYKKFFKNSRATSSSTLVPPQGT